ncbi:MAG: histone deacetylase [Candidatus Eisenbacteria bacterium]|nr:histone deacetylase [Candidatus Eisenbacteria bacterium]
MIGILSARTQTRSRHEVYRMPPVTVYYSPRYRLDWPGHVFPTEKYEGVHRRLAQSHPDALKLFRETEPAADDQILLVHTPAYLQRARRLAETPALAYSEFEIPLSTASIEALKYHTGGSIQACRDAVSRGGASINLGGGFHHAFADHGEGFCFINDVAVGVRSVQNEGLIERAAVIDCDLHQGNGTARIFQQDASVYTFSIHQEHLYPLKQTSDWDIGLEDFTGDEDYLAALENAVPKILDRHRPQLVYYVAGADPYEGDQLGRLQLSIDGLRRRDRIIFTNCKERSVPVAVGLAGGYAREAEDVVTIHANLILEALRVFVDDTG